jgi:hypothetical protein
MELNGYGQRLPDGRFAPRASATYHAALQSDDHPVRWGEPTFATEAEAAEWGLQAVKAWLEEREDSGEQVFASTLPQHRRIPQRFPWVKWDLTEFASQSRFERRPLQAVAASRRRSNPDPAAPATRHPDLSMDRVDEGAAKLHESVDSQQQRALPARLPKRGMRAHGGQLAFLTHALHQPFAATCLPANKGQPPVASFGLPWNNWQVAQVCETVCVGYFLGSTLVVSRL